VLITTKDFVSALTILFVTVLVIDRGFRTLRSSVLVLVETTLKVLATDLIKDAVEVLTTDKGFNKALSKLAVDVLTTVAYLLTCLTTDAADVLTTDKACSVVIVPKEAYGA